MAAVTLLLVMGIVLGLVIGLVVKLFGTETDPRLEELEELLPGANCGGCGLPGCAEFARALLVAEAEPGQCPSSDARAIARICELIGVEADAREPKVAMVMCGGDNEKARQAALYNGVNDCRDAMLVAGGAKGCVYGCLGLASCARACPFGAVEITAAGIAVVHANVCTGCGNCVSACPRKLIQLVPATAPVHVLCSSPEKGAAKTKVCKAACIGCRKCVKSAEDGQMLIEGFLVKVNYDDPPPVSIADVCPTKCLQPSLLNAERAAVEEEREVVNA